MLSAILAPSAGSATVAGFDVVQSPQQVRRSVGLLTEMPGLYLRMQAIEYLDFFGQLYGLSASQRQARAAALLSRFGMADTVSKRLSEYSKGMRQKLALIRAMLHDPPVLLLDEPTSAMDPQSARLVRDAIAGLRGERHAIVLCTHNLAEAEELADRIAIIRRGRIVAEGTAAALKSQLLGPPLMELRLSVPLDGLLPDLMQQVQVIERGDVWVRYRTENPMAENPRLLRWLTDRSVDVVTLSEVPRRLEDVYLRVVVE
jgi:ABC-2 type transport system ATP-binding protein